MEDLVPFLIFIVIAVANVLKFVTQKKKMQSPGAPGETQPLRQPTALKSFFEELAEKLEPQPAELPDWPESQERPDYLQEMEEFQHPLPNHPEEPLVPESMPLFQPLENPEIPPSFKLIKQAPASLFSSMSSMRSPSIPLQHSSSSRRIDFNLKNRSNLKQAMIANLIFSQPRAYDRTFDNTLAK